MADGDVIQGDNTEDSTNPNSDGHNCNHIEKNLDQNESLCPEEEISRCINYIDGELERLVSTDDAAKHDGGNKAEANDST